MTMNSLNYWMFLILLFGIVAVELHAELDDDVVASSSSVASSIHYRSTDDASWAVWHETVQNDILGYDLLSIYKQYMEDCRKAAIEISHNPDHVCDQAERDRVRMNKDQPGSMRNFTKVGFQKVRAPEKLMKLVTDFWEKNKDKQIIEWDTVSPYHNTWSSPPTVVPVDQDGFDGGGRALSAAIAEAVRDAMEEWTGQKQALASVYGIRIYHNGSILSPHVDRLPLVSSAILNVAQEVEEDWPLEAYDHDGVAHNVTMKPGDLVLYESHSVIHGRPFPFKGKFYANIFLHFEPIGPLDTAGHTEIIHNNIRYPPYLVPGSPWESKWLDENPDGWSLLQDMKRLVTDGDFKTVQYAVSIQPEMAHGTEEWRPLHEAVRNGHTDIVRFLLEDHQVDWNSRCSEYGDEGPYDLAVAYLDTEHEITQLLEHYFDMDDPGDEEDEFDNDEDTEYTDDGEQYEGDENDEENGSDKDEENENIDDGEVKNNPEEGDIVEEEESSQGSGEESIGHHDESEL